MYFRRYTAFRAPNWPLCRLVLSCTMCKASCNIWSPWAAIPLS
jgi:hypothetical protein